MQNGPKGRFCLVGDMVYFVYVSGGKWISMGITLESGDNIKNINDTRRI